MHGFAKETLLSVLLIAQPCCYLFLWALWFCWNWLGGKEEFHQWSPIAHSASVCLCQENGWYTVWDCCSFSTDIFRELKAFHYKQCLRCHTYSPGAVSWSWASTRQWPYAHNMGRVGEESGFSGIPTRCNRAQGLALYMPGILDIGLSFLPSISFFPFFRC